MDNKVKQYLNKLISESIDMGEMAQKDIFSSGYTPIYTHDGKAYVGKVKAIKDDKGNMLPDVVHVGWMIQGTPVFFTCKVDINEFLQTNKDKVEQLKKYFEENHPGQEVTFNWTNKMLPGCQPRSKMELYPLPTGDGDGDGELDNIEPTQMDTGWKGAATSMSLPEKLKRRFNPQIETSLRSFQKVLRSKVLPNIMLERGFTPNYKEWNTNNWTNDRIKFITKSFTPYKGAKDFMKCVVSSIKGEPCGEQTQYLARSFANIYNPWDTERVGEKTVDPKKTDVYQLNQLGYRSLDEVPDVIVQARMEINGERMGDSFIWSLRYVVSLGKRPDVDSKSFSINRIELKPDNYLESGPIVVTKTAQLEPGIVFDEENTVMDNLSVTTALDELLYDWKKIVSDINTKSLLKTASVRQSQIQESLIKRVVNTIKKNR